MTSRTEGAAASRPPRPVERPARERSIGPSWAWLLPVLALVLVSVFGWQAWRGQGLVVTVRADQGHGIRVGDALRYRGITAGEVQGVRLAADAAEVVLTVALEPGSGELARAGTRFWIVRPHVSLDEVTGLETLIGARYLTCLPGGADEPFETQFRALAEPPVIVSIEPGGLEIRLQGDRRHGLRRGAPLSYRGVEIGSVLEVGLASDATAVEARAYVLPAYVGLVRSNSRFWEVSGLDVSLGLTGGLSVQLESARALLVGGIALATPSEPGEPARAGQLFRLHARPEAEWLEWRPPLPIGAELDEGGPPLPTPLRAVRTYKTRRWLAREREAVGYVVRAGETLVGPADVLAPDEEDVEPELRVAGELVAAAPEVLARAEGVVRVAWPAADGVTSETPPARPLGAPEPCLLVGEPGARPLALDPARLEAQGGRWIVQEDVNPGEAWHGAAVVARADGSWIGVLLVDGRRAAIVPVPGAP